MKSFFRFLKRNPLYTLINVFGLAISLMFVILIGDYTWRQMSIDSSNPDKDRIFLFGSKSSFYSWPDPTRELGTMFPEIEKTCCVISQSGTIRNGENFLKDENHAIIQIADKDFFDFFNYRFIEGDSHSALDSPEKCVITKSLAEFLFPKVNPVGQSLTIEGRQAISVGGDDPYDPALLYTVSGVIKDLDKTILPNKTKIIINSERASQVLGYTRNNNLFASGPFGGTYSFIMLKEGADITPKLPMVRDHINEAVKISEFMGGFDEVTFTPLRKLMFAPQNDGRGLVRGNRNLLHILLAAVFVLLFFAVSNYINLTVCNTGLRAKEMATCRLLGCREKDVTLKLIGESILMVFISFVIALFLAFLFQDKFAYLFQGKIALKNDILPGTVAVSLVFIIALGALSGIIPSVQIARYKPIDVMKGSFRYHSKMIGGRVSAFAQNVITVAVLTVSLVILLQIDHLTKASLGFNTTNIVGVCPDNSDVVRSELESLPCVEKTGLFENTSLIGQPCSMTTFKDSNGESQLFYICDMDKSALDIYGLELLTDNGNSADGYYLNETGAERLGVKAGDTEFTAMESGMQLSGIFKDFHTGNILSKTVPFIIKIKDSDSFKSPYFVVRTDGSPDAVSKIREIISKADGEKDVDWKVNSFQESVSASFSSQKNILAIVRMFTFISILISVLGFIGLSLFFIRQRQKEIGLRKILSATSWETWALMFKTFYTPILYSMIPAVAIAWFLMRRYLESFSYRIALSPWIFIATCALSLLIAVASVGFQILRAVRSNPADSIKLE